MISLPRRGFLGLASAGIATLAAPSHGAGLGLGFTHDVASGEPSATSVLVWTRYVGRSGPVRLTVEVSELPDFARVAGGGTVAASAERDHTAKLVVDGLTPGRWYFYRFVAPDGNVSPTGRTRTLPVGETAQFNLGIFSCSNLPFGFFNAYGHAAARDDLDLALHLGDYLYEYRRGTYPLAAVAGRQVEPASETVHLADYRARYAAYRRDPDLRALHRRLPMIAMWDDHESANDSWEGGAENHDPATEGPWQARKAAAVRAYREWMPVSDSDWAEYRIGDLAVLFRPEERLDARTRQVDLAAAIGNGADLAAALKTFRDGPWQDPAHTLFGPAQERWFADRMRAAARETRWQVLAQQVNMGITHMPPAALDWLPPGGGDRARDFIRAGIAAGAIGLPFNMDSWNGYPAARSRVLRNGLDADANLVVLSGDSHNAWAFDLAEQGVAAGVEFGGHSVTSPGFEAELGGADPLAVARGLVGASPELKWAETSRRGYMTVRLTQDRADAEWLFLDTVLKPSRTIAARHAAGVARGARRLTS
ncbi:alkaline phosphatase D family protein [Sphingomonas solaris]|nr:alkaline phosphatase D family protein [Sphingomonas solaris]